MEMVVEAICRGVFGTVNTYHATVPPGPITRLTIESTHHRAHGPPKADTGDAH
ncbi:hypothetical protein E4U31_007958, partial [Claviceps sp. LM219 group G6]